MEQPIAYKIYQNLKEDNLCFGYQGDFSDEMTEQIVSLSEYNMNNIEEIKKLKKKVSFLLAESFQNIVRHSDKPNTKNRTTNKIGMFIARNVSSNYFIISSNIVENKNISSIRSKLERVNSLSADELKALQMEILSQGDLSEKGGAGLGFIDMVRKSGQKLEFAFEEVNDMFSFFYLIVKLKTETLKEQNENISEVSLNFAKDFHQNINDGNILMVYKGDFTQSSILPLIKVIEDNMAKQDEEFKVKRKVFLVLIELLQNSSKHALLVRGIRDGIFMIGKKEKFYQIIVGNLVENSTSEILKNKIDQVNSMSKKKLNEYYKSIIMNDEVSDKGGAGVGLIEIARSGSKALQYSFIPYNNDATFFMLNVTI